jgi:hypothetical protein
VKVRGVPNCVRLVTTRLPRVLPASHAAINIDEMRAAGALELLATGLLVETDLATRLRLSRLAERLGHWAQMLAIANGWLRGWIAHRATLGDAVEEFERRLDKGGLTDFDPKDEKQRNRAIRVCLEAALLHRSPGWEASGRVRPGRVPSTLPGHPSCRSKRWPLDGITSPSRSTG